MSPDPLHTTRLARIALTLLGPLSVDALDWFFTTPRHHIDDCLFRGAPFPFDTAPRQFAGGASLAVRAVEMLLETEAMGARVVIPEDPEWPTGLAGAPDIPAFTPPVCLWVKGPHELSTMLANSVTVTGARAASAGGADLAERLGAGLAQAGVTVVSTPSYGIDISALRGAMAYGRPVAVLPSGIDRAYPTAHQDIINTLASQALVVSQWPLGTEPARPQFTATAATLAALTGGTVVVEAVRISRVLHTARTAKALGRTVMAVPGAVTDPNSRGSNALLRDGARAVMSVRNILDDLSTPDTNP